jgi:hypothetical protein
MMDFGPVGMMTFPTEWKVIKAMFQTTNQVYIYIATCKKIKLVNRENQWKIKKNV